MDLRSWLGLSPINSWNIYEIVYSIVLVADLVIIGLVFTPIGTFLNVIIDGRPVYFGFGFIQLLGIIILCSSIFYIGWWKSEYHLPNTPRPEWATMRHGWWLLSILVTLVPILSHAYLL